jgi:hypothetical protein
VEGGRLLTDLLILEDSACGRICQANLFAAGSPDDGPSTSCLLDELIDNIHHILPGIVTAAADELKREGRDALIGPEASDSDRLVGP